MPFHHPNARVHFRSFRVPAMVAASFCAIAGWNPAAAAPSSFDTWRAFDVAGIDEAEYPTHGKVADFDGDGVPDLAVVYRRIPKLTLMFGAGDGTFGEPTHYPAEITYFVEAGDLDGDGDLDIVVPEYGEGVTLTTIALYFNQGNGTFAPRQTIAVAPKPRSVAIADLDGDGDQDLVVGAIGGSSGPVEEVAVLYNDGAGGFSAPVMFLAGIPSGGFPFVRPWTVVAGDLSGDGYPDLVIGHEYQHCSVLINDGAGGFGPPATYAVGAGPWGISMESGVTLLDAEHDGDLDVVFSCQFMKVYIPDDRGAVALLRNQGNGVLGPHEIYPLVSGSTGSADLASADVNGDGWDDIVLGWVGDGEVGWGVVPADKLGAFGAATRYIAGEQATSVSPVDIDGDGDIDVVIPAEGNRAVSVHLNPGEGDFSTHPVYPAPGFRRGHMDAGDIDNDGDEDVVIGGGGYASDGWIQVLRNQGDGTYAAAVSYPAPQTAICAKLRDLNGDNLLDLVWADAPDAPPYNFKTRMNLGGGNFGPLANWPVGTCGTWDMGVFDIDNDGDLDVLLAELLACFGILEKYIYVNLNHGDGTFAPPILVENLDGLGSFGITVADFDRDGHPDMATTTPLGIYVYPGNGDGTFGPHLTFPAPEGTHQLRTTDLNGDGFADLVGQGAHSHPASTSGGSIVVLLGNGDGTFDPVTVYPADRLGSADIDIADLDGDGDPDVFLANHDAHDVSIFFNRGDGTFDPQFRYGAAGTALGLRVRDFTGDGIPDLGIHTTGDPNPFGLVGLEIVPGIGSVATGIGAPALVAASVLTMNALPNPSSRGTALYYELPAAGPVKLQIFDVSGRRVRTIVDATQTAGGHHVDWDALNERGRRVPTGIYFARLDLGTVTASRKLTLIRQ